MSDLVLGGIIALLAAGTLGLIFTRLGLIHLGFGRRPQLTAGLVDRAYPRIRCSIIVEAKNEAGPDHKPQLRIFTTIENEGEIIVRSLKGSWKVVTPDKYRHAPVQIQRDVLAPSDKYLESYLLQAGIDTPGEVMRFDVELDFDYQAQDDGASRHFNAKYRYDAKYNRMLKL